MLRKYLIGLFILTLFVSGGLFAFLMIEESQDLSSRASGWGLFKKGKEGGSGQVVNFKPVRQVMSLAISILVRV